MNILFITIAWPKPGERNLYSDLMLEFKKQGHEIYVTAAGSWGYNVAKRSEIENGIHVLRINSGAIRKTSKYRKALSLFNLGRVFWNSINNEYPNIDFNLIIGTTPPITLSNLFKKLKRKYNAKFYLLLKDIWPQGQVDNRLFPKFTLPWLYLRRHEIAIYKRADIIGCMSPKGVEYILKNNKFLFSEKVEVCPNAIIPNLRVDFSNDNAIRIKYGIPKDSCVFIFSGNLGKGHGLYFLVDVINRIKNYKEAFFLIGGSGTHFKFLEQNLHASSPKNYMLYNWLPAEDFHALLQASDVGLILLDKCYTIPQFPSRLLAYLDAGKSVLCAANDATDIGSIIESTQCGLAVNHGDEKSFIEAIKHLAENEHLREQMGQKGRELLETRYTTKHAYDIIIKHFV